MSEPLSAAERRDLLAEYFAGREKLCALAFGPVLGCGEPEIDPETAWPPSVETPAREGA